ncbi:hypothetical protein DFH11DRAFT_1478580, partial [Phellopilus nigrolimitatus]
NMPKISTSSLAVCKWAWCKESFETTDKLVMHVLEEHVWKAKPMKRKDVPLERRAMDGTSFQGKL